VARTDYLKKSPDAVTGFLEDYVALLTYIYKPENREVVLDLVAAHFKAPKAVLQQFYLTNKDMYRRPDARLAPEDLQHALTRLAELGFLDKDLKVAPYVDNSYLPR
jgi:ABC-type nitrate/sulfonate/bicarbonate transport system substrate-binding protein